MTNILTRINRNNFLFLLDAGLYSFVTIWTIQSKKCDFLIKVSQNLKLSVMPNGRLPDGSYLAEINGKILDIKNSFVTYTSLKVREIQSEYLLFLISESEIDRPRRNRVNPRVIKIKMSKFKRKNSTHKSEIRDLKKDLEILPPQAA